MIYRPVLPIWRSLPIRPIILLLHPPSQAAVTRELVTVWQPSIPAAIIFSVVVEGNRSDFTNLPAALLDGSSAYERPLVPAVGELLCWYRAADLDAQGAVLEPGGTASTDEDGFPSALVRMSRIYLAELVAVAMEGQSQPLFPQVVRKGSRWAPQPVIRARPLKFKRF